MTHGTRQNEFEVVQDCAGLLDQLDAAQQQQVMTMLATRYGLKLVTPTTTGGGRNYKPSARRKAKPF